MGHKEEEEREREDRSRLMAKRKSKVSVRAHFASITNRVQVPFIEHWEGYVIKAE